MVYILWLGLKLCRVCSRIDESNLWLWASWCVVLNWIDVVGMGLNSTAIATYWHVLSSIRAIRWNWFRCLHIEFIDATDRNNHGSAINGGHMFVCSHNADEWMNDEPWVHQNAVWCRITSNVFFWHGTCRGRLNVHLHLYIPENSIFHEHRARTLFLC